MDKKFKVGGVSQTKGQYKVRFANDMTRVKILAKTDSDINLMELPNEMTKPELVTFLKTTDLYSNPTYREAIDAADAKYNGTVSTKATKVKAAKPAAKKAPAKKAASKKAAKPNMEDIKARAEAAAEAAAEPAAE
ncbi:MAG TPA: hypothetical protein VFM18_17705 [Methanosarcina sp.]|nr:hypothetical protein [Methanosarcina sp.]